MEENNWHSRPEKIRQLVRALVDKSSDEENDKGSKFKLLEVLNDGIVLLKKMQKLKNMKIPKVLACPLTTKLMENPVVLTTSGLTFDHHSILKWIEDGNRVCPVSRLPIPEDVTLLPNKLVSSHIAHWCALKGYPLPTINPTILEHLLTKLSSEDILITKEAASELHTICRRRASSWPFLSQSQETVSQLIAPLLKMQSAHGVHDPDLEADIISAISNMSLQDDEQNLKTIAQTPGLLLVLETSISSVNLTTRKSAFSAVTGLGKVESNATLMYSEGLSKSVLNPLLPAAESGESSALGDPERGDNESLMGDAASAIYILFRVPSNREKAVEHGVVKMFYSIVKNRILLDKLAPTVVNLSSTQKSAHELGKLGALDLMPRLIRETEILSVKESCLLVIYNLIQTFKEPDKVKELLEAEDALNVISELAIKGRSKRVKKNANHILEFLNDAEYPTPQYEHDELTEANRETLSKLLAQLSSCSLSMKKQAAQILRLITDVKVSARSFLYNTSMEDLIAPFQLAKALKHKIDANLEKDLIATVFNISKHHPTILKRTPMVISALTDALKSVRIETATHAISALNLLSKHEENATMIFKSMDAIKPLLDLLILADSYYHNQFIKKAVTETICNLFLVNENLKEAVGKDFLITLCSKLKVTPVEDREGLLSIMNVFSQSTEAVEKLVELDLLSVLLLSVKDKTNSHLIKEKCLLIVYNMLSNSNTNTKLHLKEQLNEEDVINSTIANLAENPVTRETASQILSLMQDVE